MQPYRRQDACVRVSVHARVRVSGRECHATTRCAPIGMSPSNGIGSTTGIFCANICTHVCTLARRHVYTNACNVSAHASAHKPEHVSAHMSTHMSTHALHTLLHTCLHARQQQHACNRHRHAHVDRRSRCRPRLKLACMQRPRWRSCMP